MFEISNMEKVQLTKKNIYASKYYTFFIVDLTLCLQ